MAKGGGSRGGKGGGKSLSGHSAERYGGLFGFQTNISGHSGHTHVGRGRTQSEADANAYRDYQRDHGRDE